MSFKDGIHARVVRTIIPLRIKQNSGRWTGSESV